MKTKPINLLIIALCFHIFSVNSRLLYYLNPEISIKPPFSFLNFDEPTILAMVFAFSYSLATFVVISSSKKKWLILIFASLDSLGVLLYYYTEISLNYGAIYFSLYTGMLISSAIFLDKGTYLADQIYEMKEQGMTQRQIANRLNISESKVSRSQKRENNSFKG